MHHSCHSNIIYNIHIIAGPLRVHTAPCYYVGVTAAASVFPNILSESCMLKNFHLCKTFQERLLLHSGLISSHIPETRQTHWKWIESQSFSLSVLHKTLDLMSESETLMGVYIAVQLPQPWLQVFTPAGRGTNGDDNSVGAGSYLQLALPAVNVICGLVQLLQFSLFTENMACTDQHRDRDTEDRRG